MSKINKNYDKYISPSITKGVKGSDAKGKTASGKAVQVLDNIKNIATTKAHRIHGVLKGEGWNNNLTALKAMHKDIKEVRISLNQLKESNTQMTRMNFNSKVDKLDKTMSRITKLDDLFGKNYRDTEGEMTPLLSQGSVAKTTTKNDSKRAELDSAILLSSKGHPFPYNVREYDNLK